MVRDMIVANLNTELEKNFLLLFVCINEKFFSIVSYGIFGPTNVLVLQFCRAFFLKKIFNYDLFRKIIENGLI